jgi:intron-binding protein aquarius
MLETTKNFSKWGRVNCILLPLLSERDERGTGETLKQ